jgi:hypothetical protein
VIEISREDGVFYISHKRWAPFKGMRGDYTVDKAQARAESESVLAVIGEGITNDSATYVIEKDSLFNSRGDEYTRM